MNTNGIESPGPIDNTQDLIDSRDVIQRIEDLEEKLRDESVPEGRRLTEDEAGELLALRELAGQGGDLADWKSGVTLIRDSYFEDYARELAYDMGLVSREPAWPTSYIDWGRAARDLQTEYTALEFGGVTYWAGS